MNILQRSENVNIQSPETIARRRALIETHPGIGIALENHGHTADTAPENFWQQVVAPDWLNIPGADTNPSKPDPVIDGRLAAARFVELLTGATDPVIRLRFIHDSDKANNPASECEGTITRLWPKVLDLQKQGYGCFYFLNETPPGMDGFAADKDVTRIRSLATDSDEGIPQTWHKAPLMIVRTSRVNGVQKGQALWPVFDLPVSEFKTAQLRLAAHYKSDEHITNPSRILRLPGTLHQKDPSKPQLVT